MISAAPIRGFNMLVVLIARVRKAMCKATYGAAVAMIADAATSVASHWIGGCIRIAAIPV